MRISNLISKAKLIFLEKNDQEILNKLDDRSKELEDIKSLMDSDGGKAIKKMLVDDFFIAIDNLIKTGDKHYISDLKSLRDLINKLSVDRELDQIRAYLEDKLK